MAAGGIVGGLLGLQGGCAWWLMYYISGDSVEQRWRREYLYLQNIYKQKVDKYSYVVDNSINHIDSGT